MRLNLIDRIESLESGHSITAIKSVSLAEPYLKDHFPSFPVMPGVLMLEALYQAGTWLVLEADDFHNTVVLLKEARNVKYADFVAAGEALHIRCEVSKKKEDQVTIKAEGRLNERVAVSGRLVLESFRLAERYSADEALDAHIRKSLRRKFRLLHINQTAVSG